MAKKSQSVSLLSRNLDKRWASLNMEVKDVHEALNRRGFDVAYSTVAGWFNSNRGKRWKVDELHALLDILQTDLDSVVGEGEFVEDPLHVVITRGLRLLPQEQQQAIAATVQSMLPGKIKLLPPPE